MTTRILAWDFSGSTDSMAYYHTLGKKYVDDFRAESSEEKNAKLKYLLWADSCYEVESSRLDTVMQRKTGSGGTSPSTIINWIQNHVPASDHPIDLWLITDGEIGREELTRCETLNQSMKYTRFKFIIINARKIDMSVGAAFMSNSAVEIYINERQFKTIQTTTPFNYDEIDVDNFQEKWPELTDFIQAKFMASDRGALEEAAKLAKLRKRLFDELKISVTAENEKDVLPNQNLFKSKKKADLIRDLKTCHFYRELTNSKLNDTRRQIDGMVCTLISYIHTKHKSLDFNGIKMDFKFEQIETVDDEPSLDTLVDVDQCQFFDAVTLGDELAQPILLLGVTDLITKFWEHGSYSKFRAVIDCPFFAPLEGCTGHVYSLETFKSLKVNGTLTNPMTREDVVGGLVFPTNAQADDWNDYVLAHTFFRGKKVCPDLSLWYYAIWKHFETAEWIEPEIRLRMKTYAFRRLESAKIRLAFSNFPLDPEELVPIPIACFYCVEGSSILFGEDEQLFNNERLRVICRVVNQMLEILDFFGYTDVDRKFIEARAKTFLTLRELKRIPAEVDKRLHLATKIFKTTTDGRFLTYEVKDKNAIKYFNLLAYSHKGLIPFDYALIPVNLQDYVFFSYKYESLTSTDLCQKTKRPYFVVSDTSGKNVSNYAQILQCISQVNLGKEYDLEFSKVKRLNQSKLVSVFKLYLQLAEDLNKFPTLDELKDYIARVKKFKEQRLVFLFPSNVAEMIETAYEKYQVFDGNADGHHEQVTIFLKTVGNTVSIENRINAEGRIENKLEMKKFITEAKLLLET